MTRMVRDRFDREHERARELAAARVGEPLLPEDAGWLDTHLAWCAPCRAVAGEYANQRLELRALRHEHPVPPRDLWARTSAAIDLERGRTPVRTERPAGRTTSTVRSRTTFPLGALTGALAVVFVVGATLLSGRELQQPSVPDGSLAAPTGATAAITPFPVAPREVKFVTGSGSDLEVTTSNISEVCPIDADTNCATARLGTGQDVGVSTAEGVREAVINPSKSHVVLGTENSVVVVPVIAPSPLAPTPTPAATFSAAGSPGVTAPPSIPASLAPHPSPSDQASVEPSPSPSASPGATPETTPAPSSEPPAPSPSASPEATPAASAETASPTPTGAPTEAPPSLEVTQAPSTGAITIAADVIVVGRSAAYSRDGSSFAFTARPADGSHGPDVYVWRTGTDTAVPVTTDHASVFSDWVDDQLLISRADPDGDPITKAQGVVPESILLDPITGRERRISPDPMFRPTVSPTGRNAVWWQGAIEPGPDGLGWEPRTGRLLLGRWQQPGAKPSDPGGNAAPDVLASGPVPDWDARWDETGTRLAVWIADRDDPAVGKLSLYGIDPSTGRIDKDNVLLDAAPAAPGFAIGSGRLVWAVKQASGKTHVEVLAWSSDGVGRVELDSSDVPLVVVR